MLKVNTEWQNASQHKADTVARYNKAMKEATEKFVALAEGKLEGTQDNNKWSLDGEG